jgi:hypothetical protein
MNSKTARNLSILLLRPRREPRLLLLLKQVVCDDTLTSFAKLVTVTNAIVWDREFQILGNWGVVCASHF